MSLTLLCDRTIYQTILGNSVKDDIDTPVNHHANPALYKEQ